MLDGNASQECCYVFVYVYFCNLYIGNTFELYLILCTMYMSKYVHISKCLCTQSECKSYLPFAIEDFQN